MIWNSLFNSLNPQHMNTANSALEVMESIPTGYGTAAIFEKSMGPVTKPQALSRLLKHLDRSHGRIINCSRRGRAKTHLSVSGAYQRGEASVWIDRPRYCRSCPGPFGG